MRRTSRQVAMGALLSSCVVVAAAACGGVASPPAGPSATAAPGCSPTPPNGEAPPGEPPSRYHHGNGKLWTGLWPAGVIKADGRFVQPDGSVRMKFWWWANVRVDETGLIIEGRRTDAAAPPLRVDGPSPGWPETDFRGTAFWASGLVFPSDGCWRITARVGDAVLTFVTLVERV